MNHQIALAHHWLVHERGGEKVLKALCEMFPNVDIHTLLRSRKFSPDWLRNHNIKTSVLRFCPFASFYYRQLLPLFPRIVSTIPSPFPETKVLLSSDAAVVKALSVPPETRHICYCHSPPRYLWEMKDLYFRKKGVFCIFRSLLSSMIVRLQTYDYEAAQSVDHFIANSQFVANRIKRFYGKESVVIHPPVDLTMFEVRRTKSDYFLVVSELVPYKRVDIAIRAFSKIKEKLIVAGGGPLFKSLRSAAPSNVEVMGRVDEETLVHLYARARALIFPGIEDFGITPLEAQASGTPVIGLGIGGCLETVVDGETGLFFEEQSVEGLIEAIERFSALDFEPDACRAHAERFSVNRFKSEINRFIEGVECL